MTVKPVQFESGELLLEGVWYLPSAPARAAVVVCHPNPQAAGDMDNNVVVAIAESLRDNGFAALTFNFRGVGRSQGSTDGGVGEQADVRAAIGVAAALEGIERVGLAGYSFGAGVAAAMIEAPVVAAALVAPPSGRLQAASKLLDYTGPVLLLAGEQDHVASGEALEGVSSARAGATEVVLVPGVDHFWRGAEATLKQTVGDFMSRWLAPEPESPTTT